MLQTLPILFWSWIFSLSSHAFLQKQKMRWSFSLRMSSSGPGANPSEEHREGLFRLYPNQLKGRRNSFGFRDGDLEPDGKLQEW